MSALGVALSQLRIASERARAEDESRRRLAGERAFAILAGQSRVDHAPLLESVLADAPACPEVSRPPQTASERGGTPGARTKLRAAPSADIAALSAMPPSVTALSAAPQAGIAAPAGHSASRLPATSASDAPEPDALAAYPLGADAATVAALLPPLPTVLVGAHGFVDADEAVAAQQRARLEKFHALRIRKAAEVAQRAAQNAARKADAAAGAARAATPGRGGGGGTVGVYDVSLHGGPGGAVTLVPAPGPRAASGGRSTAAAAAAVDEDDGEGYLDAEAIAEAAATAAAPSPAPRAGRAAAAAAVGGGGVDPSRRARSAVPRQSRASVAGGAGSAAGGGADPALRGGQLEARVIIGVGEVAVPVPSRGGAGTAPRGAGGGSVSNRSRIVNALKHVCLAGAHRGEELSAALAAMGAPDGEGADAQPPQDGGSGSSDRTSFLVLLASPDSPQYRALYKWVRGGACVKVHGSRLAPADISGVIEQAALDAAAAAAGDGGGRGRGGGGAPPRQWAVSATWKYVAGQRNFAILPTTVPGLTTDAISLAPAK